LALLGGSAALSLTSGSAGLAAFGTAISVPLWIVLGAGGAFAGMIIDEVAKSSHRSDDGD